MNSVHDDSVSASGFHPALSFTHFTAVKPTRLSKHFSLAGNVLVKQGGGNMTEGIAERLTVTLDEFAALLPTLKPSNACSYGVSDHSAARVVVADAVSTSGGDRPVIARTRDYFAWPAGAGLMMLDYDAPTDGDPLTMNQLRDALAMACLPLDSAPAIWRPSASSCIALKGGAFLRDLAGQRLYIPVISARDLSRAGQVLFDRLWLAGYGRYELSKSGAFLARSPIDASVFQPERLDFCGGASLGAGLEQRLPDPVIFNPDAPYLATRAALPDLDDDERAKLTALQDAAKSAMSERQAEVREQWIVERVGERLATMPEPAQESARPRLEATYRQAVDGGWLAPGFELSVKAKGAKTINKVTVGDALAQKTKYHEATCLDPLEPDYPDGAGRFVGWLNLVHKPPYITSQAHGGTKYFLGIDHGRLLAKAGYGTPASDDDAKTRTGTEKAKTETDRPGAESAGLKILGGFNSDGLICIATDEKSATSIFEHSHIAVVVAGSAQRLWQAAQDMRRANPRLKILVCGDADSADKARMAAFSLIGGSYWCAPNFLQPGRQELQDAAIALMKSPPAADDPIPGHFFKEAAKVLSARDQQRAAEESPSTFADLAGWESGAERVAQQIQAAVSQIGVIKIRPGKLPSIVDRAEKEALFLGADFYQRVGMLVRPVKQDVSTGGSVRIPAGALVLNLLNTSWLNRRFSQSAKWVKFNQEKGWIPADPPTKYADTLLAMAGEWRAPVLTGIVECPTLRRDGSLLTASGYDSESGLYVDYHGDPICVPDAPTQADALAALAILKEPFTEFPFAEGDIDLAVALSGLLTAVVRRSLRTAPLFAFDAPVMGAGKGLIVNTIATVATGRAAPAISQGKDEAEDEKRLGALLLQGVPLLNIDNIERDLQGDLLCSALTETTIAIRILGKSEVPNMPSNVAMFATGNNLRARGDMVRRMLVCRIDPACERPDARSFKRNLNEWVPANRARLLSAALTVLRAYIVAGKPKQDIPPYGSFEEWSGLVRSALVWLGMPDPNLTRVRLEAEDAVTINLHSILTLWFAAFGKNGMTAAEVATQAGLPGRDDLHRALLEVAVSKRDSEKVDALRLGHWLKKQKGKVANGLKLEKAGEDGHNKLLFWRVVNLQSAKSAGNAGIAGKDSTETRENWKTSQNASESNFSRDGREVSPQYPHYPQNPPASPPVDSAFAGRDVEEF